MKDGRTHLAHKAEHAVDLETGAVMRYRSQPGQCRRYQTVCETLTQCRRAYREVAAEMEGRRNG